ncbi:hypothetical protein ACQ4PT_005604 [Festuca glaucescens]
MRGPNLSALPDEMLQHILSFLPAQEAVQTCVLARRWRHLWRSTMGLRLIGRDGPGPARDLQKFVGNLLKLREKGTDLHTVEIKFDGFSQGDDLPYVVLWIRSALICKVRSLTLHHLGPILYLDTDQHSGPFLCELDGSHLASPYLRTVDLESVALEYSFLDFASCPALEDLKLHKCYLCDLTISSSSLKHLSITDCHSDFPCRLHVSALGLVSLRLDNFWGITPSFENMVLLETAWVNLGRHCQDELVLLGGISSARHLELISEFQNGPNHEVEMKGSYGTMEGPSAAISEHLKIVEVKCNAVDEMILEVLKFLLAFNIRKLTNDTFDALFVLKLAFICVKENIHG